MELVREQLLEAGVASETRRHHMAETYGVNGMELWVQESAQSPEAPAASPKPEGPPLSSPKPQVESAHTLPKDLSKIDSPRLVDPRRLELKEASSLLQEGIEAILVRESELAGECATLRAKVEELTGALDRVQTDAVREIQSRDSAAQDQAEQLNRVLASIAGERQEWQEKLKASDDSFKNATEQVGSLSRQLQAQQAEATAFKQEIAALELRGQQHERILSEVCKETALEREARVSAEQRASAAEESLRVQRAECEELEGLIQASLSSLLARVSSKAASASSENDYRAAAFLDGASSG